VKVGCKADVIAMHDASRDERVGYILADYRPISTQCSPNDYLCSDKTETVAGNYRYTLRSQHVVKYAVKPKQNAEPKS